MQPPEPALPEQHSEAAAPVEQERGSATAVRFTDVTAAGIGFVHRNGAYGDKLLPETMGGGVAFFDFDGDEDADLLFVDSGHWPHHPLGESKPTLALYRNDSRDGTVRFTDVTTDVGLDVSFYGMGVAIGDVDGDGWRDLFVTAVGENRLFLNRAGRFEDVTAAAGVAGASDEWSSSAGFFDADRDGDLDLFVCNYVRWSREIDDELDFRLTGVGRAYGPPQHYRGTFPYLYRNDGAGPDGTVRFSEVSEEAGLHVVDPASDEPLAKALAVGPTDVDGDGWTDVLVANDTIRNFFFRHLGADGPLRFEEVGELFGFAYDLDGNATGAMGVDWAYFRNDHNLGFAIGNFANEMSSVYVAQDDPTFFVDETFSEGIGAPSRRTLTFGVFFFDADLDGRLDFFQANGHIEDAIVAIDSSQSYRQSAQLFLNSGEAGFEQVPPEATGDLAREIVGRGAAYADVDGDGDLDVVLTQIAGPPLLLRNDQSFGHHWLRLRLVGKPPNVDAIGARVELTAGGVTQRRQVMPTRSYQSQVESVLTFGLGTTDRVDSITIYWPDGSEDMITGVEVDRLQVVRQEDAER